MPTKGKRSHIDELDWMDELAEWFKSSYQTQKTESDSFLALTHSPDSLQDLKQWAKKIGREIANRSLTEFVESRRQLAEEAFQSFKSVENAMQLSGWRLIVAAAKGESIDSIVRELNSPKLKSLFERFFRLVNHEAVGPRIYCLAMSESYLHWLWVEKRNYEAQLCDLLNSRGIRLQVLQSWLNSGRTGLNEAEKQWAIDRAFFRLREAYGTPTLNEEVEPVSRLDANLFATMPHPIRSSADCARVEESLQQLLSVLESHPVRASLLAIAWDGFRAAFGRGFASKEISVDSSGIADTNGLATLIRKSNGIADETRDALAQFITEMESLGNSAILFRDLLDSANPTPEQIRAHELKIRNSDDSSLRRTKSEVRKALSLIRSSLGTIKNTNDSLTPSTQTLKSKKDETGKLYHPSKPSSDRQSDILAAILNAGMPLTRKEIVAGLRLKTEGKIGGNLAWMTSNGILMNIAGRGYWPHDKDVPK